MTLLSNTKPKVTKPPRVQILLQTRISMNELSELGVGDYTERGLYFFNLKDAKTRFLLSPKGMLQITGSSYHELATGMKRINEMFPDCVTGFKAEKGPVSKISSSELSFLVRSLPSLDASFSFLHFPKESAKRRVRRRHVDELAGAMALSLGAVLSLLKETGRWTEGLKGFSKKYRKWAFERVFSDLSHIVDVYSQAYNVETVERAIEKLEANIAHIERPRKERKRTRLGRPPRSR